MEILCLIRPSYLPRYTNWKKKWTNINVIRTKSSSTQSLDLAYRIHGPSPTPNSVPIIVLHGLLGSKRNWETMCQKITAATNRTVVAVDIRNHGDSPHNPSHEYPELAADVSQLITKFSTPKSIVIGHSMGGRTAMVLALNEPSKVASLIVVDISPVSTSGLLRDFFPNLMSIMKSVDFRGATTLHEARKIAKNKLAESGIFDNMESMYFILMNVDKLPDKSFGWKCNVDALARNFPKISTFPYMHGKTYKGPTLFIGGQLSYYIPPDDLSGILRFFPNAQLQYIKGVGHNVHFEDPNAFFNMVVQFISYDALNQALI